MRVFDESDWAEQHLLFISVHKILERREVYYTGIVTGWGCTFCLHTVVGEGRRRKDFLNPLPGPKSRSTVCRYCRPWPFTLLIYSYV